MQKAYSLFLAAAAALILATGASAATYRLSEVQAEGYPTSLADREFARLVEERTNGRIRIDVHTSGTLYKQESSAIEALQTGDLAFTRVSASPLGNYVPNANVIQLPYIYRSGEHMWKVLNGETGRKILDGIEASGSGMVGLCYYDAGARCFYTTKPVRSVADMAGLKIRVQDNTAMVRMVELLGATGVTGIGPNEVRSAIEKGIVDGAENNWPTYQDMGDYKAAGHYVLDRHTRVPEILLMSKTVKDELPPEDFAIILRCARDTQAFEIAAWAKREKESEEIVRGAGAEVIELTPEALAEFRARMAPLYGEFGGGFAETLKVIAGTR